MSYLREAIWVRTRRRAAVVVVSPAEGNAVGQDSSEVGALAAGLDVVRVEVRLRAAVWDLAGVVIAFEDFLFPFLVG